MKPRPIRIGLLANTLENAAGAKVGGHVHFLEIAKRWDWADVVIFAPESGRVPFLEAAPNARFVAMPTLDELLKNKALLFLFRSFASVLRWKELRACDAVIATSQFLPDVLPAALFRGKRSALIVHHLMLGAGKREGPFVRNAIAFAAERVSLALAEKTFGFLICGSHLVEKQLVELGFSLPRTTTTNGVEHVVEPAGATAARAGTVYIGRIHPTKGVDELVRAWRHVVDALPGERLSLIGATDDPAFERELDALIAELGLVANVRKLGRVSDVGKNEALFGARAFAFASKEEGWGIAVAEAMRAGVPCATYALPVFDEVFPKGRLAAPIGDVKALAANLVALLSDGELHARLAAEASELSEEFSWQRAAEIEGEAVRSLLRR